MSFADDLDRQSETRNEVSRDFTLSLVPIVEAYLATHKALSQDDIDAAKKHSQHLTVATNDVQAVGSRSQRDRWQKIASELVGHAKKVSTAASDGGVRSAYEGLSHAIKDLLVAFGNPTKETLRIAYCPMAFDSKGAEWVQRDKSLSNPYYGKSMLRCGAFRTSLGPGEHMPKTAKQVQPEKSSRPKTKAMTTKNKSAPPTSKAKPAPSETPAPSAESPPKSNPKHTGHEHHNHTKH